MQNQENSNLIYPAFEAELTAVSQLSNPTAQFCHHRFDSKPAATQYKGAIATGPVRPVI